jgi:hypothetical protein
MSGSFPQTRHLALPMIAAAQAQKHVTHNEALVLLDRLVHLAVLDDDRTMPPPSPMNGQAHLVAPGASGAFAGQSGRIAWFDDGVWRFLVPQPGWTVWVGSRQVQLVQDGTGWREPAPATNATLQVERLGIGTAPDALNRLALRANAALCGARPVADGGTGDIRVVLSKEAAANTASHLFQTNFGGRAEFGLMGDDDFRIKVADASGNWRDGLRIDRATGRLAAPEGLAGAAFGGDLVVNGDGAINQRGFAGGALANGAYGVDRWRAAAASTSLQVAADGTFTLTGSIAQTLEPQGLAGQVVTLSIENPSGPVAVTLAGLTGTIPAGTGRRSMTLTVPAAATGPMELRLTTSVATTFARVKLERGTIATGWLAPPPGFELARARRYFVKTTDLAVAPVTGAGLAGALAARLADATAIPLVHWRFPVEMRAIPTVSVLNPRAGGAAGQWTNGATDQGLATTQGVGAQGVTLTAGAAAGSAGTAWLHATASAEY